MDGRIPGGKRINGTRMWVSTSHRKNCNTWRLLMPERRSSRETAAWRASELG